MGSHCSKGGLPMLNRILFPALNQIQIEKWNIETQLLTLNIYLQPRQARCPDCETFSDRIHSRYRRTIFDLPCAGLAVKIIVTVRRFFCPSSSCPRVTFAEQIDDLAPRYARRTKRLIETQRLVGFELGGEAGKRL